MSLLMAEEVASLMKNNAPLYFGEDRGHQ